VLTAKQLHAFELRERRGMSIYSIAYALGAPDAMTIKPRPRLAQRTARFGQPLSAFWRADRDHFVTMPPPSRVE
jgi:hypothetical protein